MNNFFQNHCNITDGMLYRVGRQAGGGGAGGGGGWEARGGLNPPLGLFGLAMGPRSASHWPKHA